MANGEDTGAHPARKVDRAAHDSRDSIAASRGLVRFPGAGPGTYMHPPKGMSTSTRAREHEVTGRYVREHPSGGPSENRPWQPGEYEATLNALKGKGV